MFEGHSLCDQLVLSRRLFSQVHVYGESIFKYIPQFVHTNLGCVEFHSCIKRGASIRALSNDICSDNCIEGKPHTVLVHVGTNNLANYVFDEEVEQHCERIVNEYVRLAEKFLDLHDNKT